MYAYSAFINYDIFLILYKTSYKYILIFIFLINCIKIIIKINKRTVMSTKEKLLIDLNTIQEELKESE
jgi:hypothetical protein